MRKATTLTVVLLSAGALLALGFAIAAFASPGSSARSSAGTTSEETHESTTEAPAMTIKYKASLGAKAEVPKPKGVPANAGGTLSVALKDDHGSYSIAWTLTYKNLTGKALAAHIHRGKPGKAGPVIVALCGPCKSGQKGSARVAKPVVSSIKTGAAYVNVHTETNKAGEIRGQLKK